MKIELENVGKINKAQIRLDGITVIAGENSTGKSTVGKMLFCVFKAFYRMEEHIQFEKVNTVRKTVTNYFFETFNRDVRSIPPVRRATWRRCRIS